MADGSIGKLGNNQIIANFEQQAMLPSIKNTFISSDANEILMPLVEKSGFLEISRIHKFGAKTLFTQNPEMILDKYRQCSYLKNNLSEFYKKSGNYGMPWGKWYPKYIPVGLSK